MKPLYDFVHEKSKFHRNSELEVLFQRMKTYNTKDFTLTLPQPNHPLIITVDISLIGIGCILFQKTDKKLEVIPLTFSISCNNEHKLYFFRELIGVENSPTF